MITLRVFLIFWGTFRVQVQFQNVVTTIKEHTVQINIALLRPGFYNLPTKYKKQNSRHFHKCIFIYNTDENYKRVKKF